MLRASYVCGIAECLFKTTLHKKKKKKSLLHPLMSLRLCFSCHVDRESFSVVLWCEKLLLSYLFGLNKNVPICVSLYAVELMFCLARICPQQVFGHFLN